MIKQQKPTEAFQTLKENPDAIYLDVRTEPEFAQGHPTGARNIPVVLPSGGGRWELNEEFLKVAQSVLPKNAKLVVGCMAGGRSQRACEALEEAGYTDLTNVQGGFGGQRDVNGVVITKGWRDEGLPISEELGDLAYQALRTKAGL